MVGLKAQEDAFTELPVNTQGVIGQNVTLNCALRNGVHSLFWQDQRGVNIYEKGIGILPGYEGQYVVEESGTNYNLVIINADQQDAGFHTCECASLSTSVVAAVILLCE